MTRYAHGRLKRSIDVAGAVIAGVVLSPLLAAVSVALRLREGRPVLFRQVRVGRAGAPFELLKFRSMRPHAGEGSALLSDGDRVHALGRLLRRTSIDELPAIWNVIRGDLSLVGPRPLLPLHVPLYRVTHPERLTLRPGITGLAQVRGRQDLTFRQRLDADVEYAQRASFRLDVVIVLRTVLMVLRGGGVRTGQELADVDDIGLGARILAASRAEHGSFLAPHGPIGAESSEAPPTSPEVLRPILRPPLPAGEVRGFGTARQALVTLVSDLSRVDPPLRRVLVPAYYCHDVTDVLRRVVAVDVHPSVPGRPPHVVEAAEDELVIVSGFLGAPPSTSVRGGRLLVDATHALGLDGGEADAAGRPGDWCVASLRKTLPVPDGALLWSAAGRPLPAQPPLGASHRRAAERVAELLARKHDHLTGGPVEKEAWYPALDDAIAAMESDVEPSAALPQTVARLVGFDVAARWGARATNHAALTAALAADGVSGAAGFAGAVEVLPGPAFLGLRFPDRALRDDVRARLIAQRIYPAVLWPQPDVDEGDPARDLADRHLVLHVDARYGPDDMRHVAAAVAAAVLAAGADAS